MQQKQDNNTKHPVIKGDFLWRMNADERDEPSSPRWHGFAFSLLFLLLCVVLFFSALWSHKSLVDATLKLLATVSTIILGLFGASQAARGLAMFRSGGTAQTPQYPPSILALGRSPAMPLPSIGSEEGSMGSRTVETVAGNDASAPIPARGEVSHTLPFSKLSPPPQGAVLNESDVLPLARSISQGLLLLSQGKGSNAKMQIVRVIRLLRFVEIILEVHYGRREKDKE